MTALIEFDLVHYRPPGLSSELPDILRGITFQINKGALVALIGKNGSGKTTLLQHINGLLIPTSGRVIVEGMDTSQIENHKRLRSLAGMVFQNPAEQIVASTVEEDIAFGLENFNMPSNKIRTRVDQQLASSGLFDEATRPPHLLSGGQIQKLALAGILVRKPQLLLFDEPTSMLDAASRDTLMEDIIKLHHEGYSIVYITHEMDEVVHADQVIVMDQGQIVMTGKPGEIFPQRNKLYEIGLSLPGAAHLAHAFQSLGWKIDQNIFNINDLIEQLPEYHGSIKNTHPPNNAPALPGEKEIISMRDVHYTYLAGTPFQKKALNGVSLTTFFNRIHLVCGSNGSGKSTLLQHLNGILRPDSGSVNVCSLSLDNPKTLLRSVIQKVGLVFQNPESQFFEMNVFDEIAYGPKQFGMDSIEVRIKEALSLVGLDIKHIKSRNLMTLSGGEKRKVALASTLVLDQDILLFDEPTAGMDPQSRTELLALFRQLNNKGKTIIISSHQLGEMISYSTDLTLMENGRVLQTGANKEVITNEKLLSKAGLKLPLPVEISKHLIKRGWPISGIEVTSIAKLVSNLKELM